MNLEPTASSLRDIVQGTDKASKTGMQRVPGLLEILQACPPAARDQAMLHLGRILGVADVLAGLKDKG